MSMLTARETSAFIGEATLNTKYQKPEQYKEMHEFAEKIYDENFAQKRSHGEFATFIAKLMYIFANTVGDTADDLIKEANEKHKAATATASKS